MTKHALIALTAIAAALTFNLPTRASDTTSPAPSSADHVAALRERMRETSRELNLTPEQVTRLQAIVRERMGKLRQLRQDTTLSPEEKHQKLVAARREVIAEVKQVLTPDQFQTWRARQGLTAQRPARPLARLNEAINDLNLTDQQKEQLMPLYLEQIEKLRDLQQDSSLSLDEKLDKLKAIHAEAAPRLKQVLDAEQYAKWEKDIAQWLDQLKQHLPERKPN